MLSILCSMLWGHVGFNVGVFIGGLMMQTKHGYKREDVKKDKLEKWYLNYLKNKKYPSIEDEANRSKNLLGQVLADLKTATTLPLLEGKTAALKVNLVQRIITDSNLPYFVSEQFKNKNVVIPPSANLYAAQTAHDKVYDELVGELGVQDAATYAYTNAKGSYRRANTNIDSERQRVVNQIGDLARTSSVAFQNELSGINTTSAYQEFIQSAKEYTAAANKGAPSALGFAGGRTITKLFEETGKEAVRVWVNEKIRIAFLSAVEKDIDMCSDWLDAPLARALKAYQVDQAKAPSADEYNPEGTKTVPLTSPEVCDGPGEQDNWETLSGENQSKRIGLAYGFSVGYEKEMDANHTFVGGNAFAKKDNMTIKYDLQVEKGSPATFGELETKPGYTMGLTVVAGKHLNPVFSVFGRGTFEFTKYDFTYNVSNDSPKIAKESLRTQTLGNWVKQAAVGVGARYNFAPLWSAEACYDFVPATKTNVRDFNKLGEDGRRRGYIYTTSQHRVFLKIVRFFKT